MKREKRVAGRLPVLTLMILAGCGDMESQPAQPAAVTAKPATDPEVEHALKPEMVITFTQGNLACLSKDDLHEFLDHGARHEATKMRAMMVENGGSCFMVPSNKRVKLISVEYNDPEMPEMALLEFVGQETISATGAWALSIGAEPAQPAEAKSAKHQHTP